ncbi:MAG: hypothetical protein Q4A92_07105 [Corynebacterium sp.]|nr:hypothetical protein [Corynebacterium sp.]
MSSERLYRAARISGPTVVVAWIVAVVTGLIVNEGDVVQALLFPPALFVAMLVCMPLLCYFGARQLDQQASASGEG